MAANIRLELRDGAVKTFPQSGNITLGDNSTLTAQTVQIVNDGPTAGSGLRLNTGSRIIATGPGDVVIIATAHLSNSAGSSAVTAASGRYLIRLGDRDSTLNGIAYNFKQYNAVRDVTFIAQATGNGVFYTENPPAITVSLVKSGAANDVLVSKVYDTTTAATLIADNYKLGPGFSGDVITLNNPTAATYNDKNAGTDKAVTVTGLAILSARETEGDVTVYGYQLASTLASANIGEITVKPLTVTGNFDAEDKVYNTNTDATINTGDLGLSGVFGGDEVTLSVATGSFDTKNVGANKTVTLSGGVLGGADAANYALGDFDPSTLAAITADITVKSLTVTGNFNANNKEYDATRDVTMNANDLILSEVISGDEVTLSATGCLPIRASALARPSPPAAIASVAPMRVTIA